MKQIAFGALLLALPAAWMIAGGTGTPGEPAPIVGDYKLLDPITHGDLTAGVAARSVELARAAETARK